VNGCQVLLIEREDAVGERFHLPADHGQGGAQLVSDVGHHGASLLLVALQVSCHLVERLRQVAYLVVRIDGHAVGQLSRANTLGGVAHRPQRASQGLGEQQAQHQRREAGNPPSNEDRAVQALGELALAGAADGEQVAHHPAVRDNGLATGDEFRIKVLPDVLLGAVRHHPSLAVHHHQRDTLPRGGGHRPALHPAAAGASREPDLGRLEELPCLLPVSADGIGLTERACQYGGVGAERHGDVFLEESPHGAVYPEGKRPHGNQHGESEDQHQFDGERQAAKHSSPRAFYTPRHELLAGNWAVGALPQSFAEGS